MSKNVWVQPQTAVQQFVANEYVANSCAEAGVEYLFECNAGSRWSSYNVYLEDGTPYATSGPDYGGCKTDYDSYHPCYETHEAPSNSGFLKGYMYKQNLFGGNTGERIDVIIWTENYTNVHCTTKLDMNKWDKTFS